MSLSRDERQFVNLRSQPELEPCYQGWRISTADTLVGWTGQNSGNGIASGGSDSGLCGRGCARGCLRENRAVGVAFGYGAANFYAICQRSCARDTLPYGGCCNAGSCDTDSNGGHVEPAGVAASPPDRCAIYSNRIAAASNSDPACTA